MLSALLLPTLHERFPNRGLREGDTPGVCAVFPAIHPDVGDIQIYDDGDELTVVAGNFTHGHFSNYDESRGVEEKELQIVDAVADFLEDLFADRIVLWGSQRGSGGWYYPEHAGDDPGHEREHVWSGPRPRSGK